MREDRCGVSDTVRIIANGTARIAVLPGPILARSVAIRAPHSIIDLQTASRCYSQPGRFLDDTKHIYMTLDRQIRTVFGRSCLVLVLVLMGCTNLADTDVPDLERRAIALNKTIMCPVCPGESIDQSQNPLAVQMRAIASEMLTAGSSEQEIRDFFVERYGPSVLLEPPTRGFGLSAWIVPPVAFALAVAALLLTLRWMRMTGSSADRQPGGDGHPDHSGYARRLERAVSSVESDRDEAVRQGPEAGSDGPGSR